MKIPDANLLLYAVDARSPHHRPAKAWLEERLSASETFGLAWAVLIAFARISTHARIFTRPLTVAEAMDHIDSWLGQPSTTVVTPTDRHPALLRGLLEPLGAAGNLTTDAHLATLAIEHGAELCSADADFSRFAGVRWVNPLRAAA